MERKTVHSKSHIKTVRLLPTHPKPHSMTNKGANQIELLLNSKGPGMEKRIELRAEIKAVFPLHKQGYIENAK